MLSICSFFFSFSKISDSLFYNIKFYLYLENGFSEKKIQSIKKDIDEIFSQNSIKYSIVYQSKEDAFKEFLNDKSNRELKIYIENPLRDNFEIKIKKSLLKADNQNYLKKLSKLNGVFEIETFDIFPEKIREKVEILVLVIIVFVLTMIIIVVFGIFNTVKNSLFSQRFLIRTMTLVGAKRKFIEFPYLIQNILSAVFLTIFTSGIFLWSLSYFNLDVFYSGIYSSLCMMILNLLVTYFATKLALNKYLKMALDDFYRY